MLRSLLAASVTAAALALPAVSGASTVTAAPIPGDTLSLTTFSGGPGASDVTLTSSAVWTDAGQTLTASGSCTGGPVVTCPRGDVIADLGDGADRFVNPFLFYNVTVHGGDGKDTISANGNATSVTGDDGADHIDVRANGGPIADGGRGADELRGGYPRNAATRLTGDTGQDLLVGGSLSDALDGGPGADELVATQGFAGHADGGDGPDTLVDVATVAIPGTYALNGGDGKDVIVGGRWRDVVDGGNGADVIDVHGDPANTAGDAVVCGAGRDTVYADANDSVAADCETVLPGPAPDLPSADAAIAHVLAAFPDTDVTP